MQAKKRKLFIVSYRVPEMTNGASSGGLVVALSPFFNASAENKHFDEVILCGFSNETTTKASNKFEIQDVPGKPFLKRALLRPTEEEHKTGYEGYINGVLWPLAHGMVDKIDPDAIKYYPNYRALNHRFATALQKLIGSSDDLIKLEDYHFEFLGDSLRSLGVINKIGHFSHIPKERISDFEKLPAELRSHLQQQENDLNRAKLACDVLGFQRAIDLVSFKEHLGVFGPAPVTFDVERTTLSGRSTKLGVFPASIDTALDSVKAAIPMTDEERKMIDPDGRINPKARIATWAGRGDLSKNVPTSYDDFTAVLRDPDFVRKIQMSQGIVDDIPIHVYGVSTPTRNGVYGYAEETQAIKRAHERLVETHQAQNGFSSATLNEKGIMRDSLLKHYRNSVGYFISIRDGQHLGAYEHVVAQDPNCPNPLIVSSEAGAADNLPGALKVNPHNREECQQAIKQAFLMTPETSFNRHAANMKVLRRQDSAHQINAFIRHMVEP